MIKIKFMLGIAVIIVLLTSTCKKKCYSTTKILTGTYPKSVEVA
jgi:cyanate permease